MPSVLTTCPVRKVGGDGEGLGQNIHTVQQGPAGRERVEEHVRSLSSHPPGVAGLTGGHG